MSIRLLNEHAGDSSEILDNDIIEEDSILEYGTSFPIIQFNKNDNPEEENLNNGNHANHVGRIPFNIPLKGRRIA